MFSLETKSIMISIQYFAIIYIAFENLTLGLNASDTIPTIVVNNILRYADLHLKQIMGISPRHAQNPLWGERRKTLSITHHALSPPPLHHHLYIRKEAIKPLVTRWVFETLLWRSAIRSPGGAITNFSFPAGHEIQL